MMLLMDVIGSEWVNLGFAQYPFKSIVEYMYDIDR
jgi:hypothetical protein